MHRLPSLGLLPLGLLLALAACAGGPLADPQQDQQAKQFVPPEPGKGALYIYRKEIMSVARPIDVAIVGGMAAKLGVNNYVRLEGPPGPIEVDCRMGDKTGAGQARIEEGRTTFVAVSTRITLTLPGCEVAEVSPAAGEAAVRASKRVEPQ